MPAEYDNSFEGWEKLKNYNCKKNIDKPTRKKNIAVLIAVFFSFWTWSYSYSHDYKRFWIYFACAILFCWSLIIPLFIWIAAIVDAVNHSNKEHKPEYEWR